mmetsp:Transcript_102514/g.316363  ORF Transcript_102514/g.316363 Transcript_102514/m.316363 type:complete len:239 (+) Transcript_102514:330-1046(+)
MDLGPRQEPPEGAQHLPSQDVEAAHVHAYLDPLAGGILDDVAALGDQDRLAVVRVEQVRHVHILGVHAVRDRLEEARLLVLLLFLLDPAEEAALGVAGGSAGPARGASAEVLEDLDAGRGGRRPQGVDGLGLDVEHAHHAAARVLLEGVQASLVGEHHVDADDARQRAVRRPLQGAAATSVALAVLLWRRRELPHVAADDVLDLHGGLDGVAAEGLVHAVGALHLGAGLLVVGTAANL